eukprot:NODE_12529_length_1219_cov_5.320513.p1 GENE.NODE_12529_length_1219_cov_5.320513~~NODE_12529_length_1219_cov_5.320513.p1  ORF type:complete len:312 (+),score=99.16 NODE_12529_length_1219_cov_5.320513:64-999(+)
MQVMRLPLVRLPLAHCGRVAARTAVATGSLPCARVVPQHASVWGAACQAASMRCMQLRSFAAQAEPKQSVKPAAEEAGAEDISGGSGSGSSSSSSSREADAGPTGKEKADAAGESEGKAGKAEEASKVEAEEVKEIKKTPLEELQQEHEALMNENAKRRQKLLLLLADFENDKKRFQRARHNRRRGAIVSFSEVMIGALGEFDKAPELQGSAEGPTEALQQGVDLTRDLFVKTLEKFNVAPMSVEIGLPYMASRHEVVGEVEGSEFGKGMVTEIVEGGWMFTPQAAPQRVVQKAKVKTSRGTAPQARKAED